MRTKPLVLVLVSLAALGLVGCSSDGSDEAESTTTTAAAEESTTTGAGAKPHTEASVAELETWQSDLNAVGCWAGPVDGELGPETEAAIKAFQAAEGLTVDGLLGPATEGALTDAVDAGETVCTDTTSGTTTPSSGGAGESAELSAPSYGKAFTVGSCESADETSITLQGQADGITLQASASGGSGTLAVDGGTEGDGITLNGTVSSVEVGDTGDFTVEGTFSAPNFAGEAFTLTGSCA